MIFRIVYLRFECRLQRHNQKSVPALPITLTAAHRLRCDCSARLGKALLPVAGGDQAGQIGMRRTRSLPAINGFEEKIIF
jgi:hypothetical protein